MVDVKLNNDYNEMWCIAWHEPGERDWRLLGATLTYEQGEAWQCLCDPSFKERPDSAEDYQCVAIKIELLP